MGTTLDILKDFPKQDHAQWLTTVEKDLKGKPFEKTLVKKTYEGIDIQPMYFDEDLDNLAYVDSLPGQAPYLRGITAAGAVRESWGIAQEITLADPAECNQALQLDLSRGQNSINVVFDQATRAGLDPDQATAELVGKDGLSLTSLADAEAAFAGLDLSQRPCRFVCGSDAVAQTALVVGWLEKHQQESKKLRGSICADPLAVLAETGSLSYSLDTAYDRMAQLCSWAKEDAPGLRTVAVKVSGYQNSGASAAQEIAFALAAGVAHIRALRERGLDIQTIAEALHFEFAIGADFFMEIAKFRAARLCWSQVVESFGGDEECRKMHVHAVTSRWNKTEVDPWVNMLRVSTEAFSGIAGGVESLHVGPFDEVFRIPNEFSRRIARNVQIVLREEGHFDKVIDPAGGCWYVEQITSQLAEKAWQLFQQIEGTGGMPKALLDGFPQQETTGVAAKRAKNIATRTDKFVGTSMYPNLLEKPIEKTPFDHAAFQKKRTEQLAGKKGMADLAPIYAAKNETNSPQLMRAAIQAAKNDATLGEICAALAKDGDETIKAEKLNIHRGAEPFEKIRRATEAYIAKTGHAPELFLANMGPIPQHKARADFATAFFNVAALATTANDGFKTVEEACKAALASGTKAMIICSTDDTYPEIVPTLAKAVKAAKADMMIILAGYPKEYIESFKEAGVDEFLHVRANALDLLSKVQQHLEVIA